MDTSIVFAEPDYHALRGHLLTDATREQGAFLLATRVETERTLKLAIQDVLPLDGDESVEHDGARLAIRLGALFWATRRAAAGGLSVVVVRSHPWATDWVDFSAADERDGRSALATVRERVPGQIHGSMLLGYEAVAARLWRGDDAVPVDRIVVVGPHLHIVAPQRPRPVVVQPAVATRQGARLHARLTADGGRDGVGR